MIFEQPMNEHTRVCIRLEYLFNTLDAFMPEPSVWASKSSVEYLNQIIELLDRPDLRKKLSQELNRQISYLTKLKQNPSVDGGALDTVIDELHHAFDILQGSNDKFAHSLRCNEFLSNIRQYQLSPGGLASYNTPEFQLWLQQHESIRQQQLHSWVKDLEDIRNISGLVLRLVRQSSGATPECAEKGFYQKPLDSQSNCQLVRVQVPNMSQPIFPVISASRHAISIRFNELSTDGTGKQCESNIEFALTCCIL